MQVCHDNSPISGEVNVIILDKIAIVLLYLVIFPEIASILANYASVKMLMIGSNNPFFPHQFSAMYGSSVNIIAIIAVIIIFSRSSIHIAYIALSSIILGFICLFGNVFMWSPAAVFTIYDIITRGLPHVSVN